MRVSPWSVPVLLVLMTVLSLGASRRFAIPSLTTDYRPVAAGSSTTVVVLLVDGVRCVDTARRAASALNDLEGVVRLVAYASRSRVEVTFDPDRCSADAIREAFEGPVFVAGTGEFVFGAFRVVEIDGRPVEP